MHTDPALLRTVLYEILKNAVQHGPDQGTRVEVHGFHRGRQAVIAVVDNGSGVRSEHIKRIKEKFTRVDDSLNYRESGTGLGLYLADRISEILGGTLVIENVSRGGLRAEVRLPA